MRYFSFDQTIGESKIYGFGGKSGGGTGGKLSLEDYLLTDNGLPALTYAMLKLIPDGVAWVLDIENRQVSYTAPIPPPEPSITNSPFLYSNGYGAMDLLTAEACGQNLVSSLSGASYTIAVIYPSRVTYDILLKDGTTTGSQCYRDPNPQYVAPDPSAPTTEEKHIAISVIADNVVINAADGNPDSITAVGATLPRP